MKSKVKHFIFAPLVQSLVILLLYLWFKGESGGDIALRIFSLLFLLIFTLFVLIDMLFLRKKDKKSRLIGLFFAFGVHILALKIIF